MARLATIALALALALAAPALAQKLLGRAACEGRLDGQPLTGEYRKEYWSHYDTYRHAGTFTDPRGNRYDFAVFTASDQGVGGAWMNHMKHRETRVFFRADPGGFILRDETGQVLRFTCKVLG